MTSYPIKIFPDDFSNKRFWDKVDIRGPDECWPWLRSLNTSGRGQHSVKGVAYLAARLILFGLERSPLLACHKCDNPVCVNPKHLFAGTYSDNANDCLQKGRNLESAIYFSL